MNRTIPTVSVILPTYNRASLLHRAIQSVLCQSFEDFEVIVVDDASTDTTEQVVASFQDRRIRYVQHSTQRGAAAARNTGIRLCQSAYVAFQDSDDEWLPQKLSWQVAVLRAAPPTTGVVYGGFQIIRPEHVIHQPSRLRRLARYLPLKTARLHGDLRKALLQGNWITTQVALVRRTCLEYVGGFDEALPRFQDWDLWLRLAQHYDFWYINQTLLRMYFTPESISANRETLTPAFERLMHTHATGHSHGRYLVAHYWYALGSRACYHKQYDPGLSHLLRAILLCPRNSHYWLTLLAALAGERAYRRAASLLGGYTT